MRVYFKKGKLFFLKVLIFKYVLIYNGKKRRKSMRAPFQVLVIPFKKEDNDFLYGVFLRKDLKIWQFIAGGGEDYDKSIYEAARREAIS